MSKNYLNIYHLCKVCDKECSSSQFNKCHSCLGRFMECKFHDNSHEIQMSKGVNCFDVEQHDRCTLCNDCYIKYIEKLYFDLIKNNKK